MFSVEFDAVPECIRVSLTLLVIIVDWEMGGDKRSKNMESRPGELMHLTM